MTTLGEMLKDIAYDLEFYKMRLKKPKIGIILLFPGFQALAFYRVQVWLNTHHKSARFKNPLWWPVIAIEVVLKRIVEMVTSIHISPEAHLAPGIYMPHFGGIVVGEYTVIGKNSVICQNVTFGFGIRGDKNGFPKLGDRVYLAPGAVLIGPVVLGDDCMVGANSVVTKSFPDRSVVGGVPAKLLSMRGSFDYQHYPNMKTDPARIASLALRDSSQPAQNYMDDAPISVGEVH